MKSEKGTDEVQYWLFQIKANVLALKTILRAEKLSAFVVNKYRRQIKIGDRVILWQMGENAACCALATVLTKPAIEKLAPEEQVFYKTYTDEDYRVRLRIEYNLWDQAITPEMFGSNQSMTAFFDRLGTNNNYRATKKQYEWFENRIKTENIVQEPPMEYLLQHNNGTALNTILYGPPGTGKTYHTINYALSILENRSLEELALEDRRVLKSRFSVFEAAGQIQFITFHQSFAYEDFVEGIKPFTEAQQVQYSVEDGIFKQICSAAREHLLTDQQTQVRGGDKATPPDWDKLTYRQWEASKKYVLIIDEINRGNIANIFGELISLIETDKRAGMPEAMRVALPYSKDKFSVPPNVYLLGTMNTADRSIEALDLALRRRFNFIELQPQPHLIARQHARALTAGIHLERMLKVMNERIELLLNKDYCIGHAYFMDLHNLEQIKAVFEHRIIPLLKEYFFGDYAKIGLVLGQAFLKARKLNPMDVFADFEHEYAHELADKQLYEIRAMEELTEVDFIRIYQRE